MSSSAPLASASAAAAAGGTTTTATATGTSALPPRRLQHRLLHTRLTVDFVAALSSSSRFIPAVAELVLIPLSERLRVLTFCCRGGYVIDEVLVDGQTTSWQQHWSTLLPSPAATLADIRDVRCLEFLFDDEMDVLNSGNVVVKVPTSVRHAMKEREKARKKGTEEVDITGDVATEDAVASLIVTVRYRIARDCSALEWWSDGAGGVAGESVVLTATTAGGDASLWFPCFDVVSERSTFDIDVLVPAPYTAVASGALSARRYEDDSRSVVRFSFVQQLPVASRSVGLAVGKFMLDVDDRFDYVSYFFPAALHAAYVHAVTAAATVATCIELFTSVLDGFPFPYLHVLFCSSRVPHSYAGLLLLPVHLLTDARLIDPVYDVRPRIAYELAMCWLSALQRDSASDDWLAVGMSGWLQAAFVERVFGHGESEWRSMIAAMLVCREDADAASLSESTRLCTLPSTLPVSPSAAVERAFEARSLYWTGYGHPSELQSSLHRRKAAVLMMMLQQRIGSEAFQQLWRRVMSEHSERQRAPNAVTEDGDDDVDDGQGEAAEAGGRARAEEEKTIVALSTGRFVELVKEASSDPDLQSFLAQWLYSDAYPLLSAYFHYNAKRKDTIVQLRQEQCFGSSSSSAHPGLLFSGLCKFVVHESERVTKQERYVNAVEHEFDFSCFSKVRRNRKRKQYDRETLQLMQGSEDELQKLLTRHNDTPVLWLRADVQHAFLQPVDAIANEVMLCSQLTSDKDVRGQVEAACALWRLFLRPERDNTAEKRGLWVESAGSEGLRLSGSALKACFANPNAFYRVRLLCARILALSSEHDATESSDRAVLEGWLQRDEAYDKERQEWMPNRWTELSDYFIQQALPLELSRVRITAQRLSPSSVVRLVTGLLRDNDNERNAYADDHYVAALLTAAGNLRLAETESKAALIALVRRYIAHDAVLPSYQRCVTQAGLAAACSLQRAHRIPEDTVPYVSYLSAVHPPAVRIAAFRCVVLLSNTQPARRLPHLLAALSERDLFVRCGQLRAWCRLIGDGQFDCMGWTRSRTSAHAVALSDAMWAALLATFPSSSDPVGLLYPVRSVTLQLYRLLFGAKTSAVASERQRDLSVRLYGRLAEAAKAREFDDDNGGGSQPSQWRSVTARRYLARSAVKSQRAKMEVQSTGLGSAGSGGADGHGGQTGRIKIRRGRGGDMSVTETIVLQHDAEDTDDDEWTQTR